MIRTVYQVKRGTTLGLYVEAVTGDPATASNLRAQVKPVTGPAADIPAQSVPPVATLTVTLAATGWNVEMDAAQSEALAVGFYALDMAFDVSGQTFVTEAVILQLSDAVSVP